MRKFFCYALMFLVGLRRLSEAVNEVSTPSELDNIVLNGGKNEIKS